jgi:hypothetical protein
LAPKGHEAALNGTALLAQLDQDIVDLMDAARDMRQHVHGPVDKADRAALIWTVMVRSIRPLGGAQHRFIGALGAPAIANSFSHH